MLLYKSTTEVMPQSKKAIDSYAIAQKQSDRYVSTKRRNVTRFSSKQTHDQDLRQ